MKLNQVIVVYKQGHFEAIEQVRTVLKGYKISYRLMARHRLKKDGRADLIITVGGDGTVLAAAHLADKTPILGLNPTPKRSVGFFCEATTLNFKKLLGEIMEGHLKTTKLPLLQASINGRKIPYPALNDVLFTSCLPAETSRYTICAGSKREFQKSSGVWIAAGPGSTAAIHSAGGKKMPLKSEKIQFLARELHTLPKRQNLLKHGFVKTGGAVTIISHIENAIACLDGAHITYKVPRGSHLFVRIARKRLNIFL